MPQNSIATRRRKHSFTAGGRIWLLVIAALLAAVTPPLAARERIVYHAGSRRVVMNSPEGIAWSRMELSTLVALGKCKVLREIEGGRRQCILEVEEVLYGDRRVKSVNFSAYSEVKEGRGIYILKQGTGENALPYSLSSSLPEEELPAARGLCVAHLADLALSADTIFIGEEVPADPGKWEVKVLEHVSGDALPLQTIIPLFPTPGLRPAVDPGAPPEKRLYFVECTPALGPHDPAKYRFLSALPVNTKAEVLAAVARRHSFPVIDNGTPKTREVIFDGTADEAVKFLSSPYDEIQTLGHRYLIHHPEAARMRLPPLIEGAWLQAGLNSDKNEEQRLRIETLGITERKSPGGALVKLAEKLISRLEALPPEAAVPARVKDANARRHYYEEDDTDSNHSLAWLLREMDEEEVTRRWGDRLLALKDRLSGWGREEVILAIDVMRIESNRELTAALARTQGIQPMRSPRGGPHKTSVRVYFSIDSRRLSSIGRDGSLCHWDATTMNLIDQQPGSAKVELVSVREPDGKYALFVEGKGLKGAMIPKGPGKLSFVELESGSTVSQIDFPGEKFGPSVRWLSGGQMVIFGALHTTFVDFLNGKIVQEFPRRPLGRATYISADRRSVLTDLDYKAPGNTTHRYDLTTGTSTEPHFEKVADGVLLADGEAYTLLHAASLPWKLPKVRGVTVEKSVLSPDGRRLAVVTGERIVRGERIQQPNAEAPAVVRIHDTDSLQMICAIRSATRGIEVRFNTDGTQLVIAHSDGTIERWPLPE